MSEVTKQHNSSDEINNAICASAAQFSFCLYNKLVCNCSNDLRVALASHDLRVRSRIGDPYIYAVGRTKSRIRKFL